MFVRLKKCGYSFDENITGQKVIARSHGESGGVTVQISELMRVGIVDSSYLKSSQCNFGAEDASDSRFFFDGEFEIIPPTMLNCSDSNVGMGWGGFYEQEPIKRSKFR